MLKPLKHELLVAVDVTMCASSCFSSIAVSRCEELQLPIACISVCSWIVSTATISGVMSSGQEPQKKGLLDGIRPDQAQQSGLEIYHAGLTLEDLFGEGKVPTGGALLDQVLAIYGDGHINVPWFVCAEGSSSNAGGAPETSGGSDRKMIRSIVRSPLSRELQQSTVEAYKDRILAESISQVAAGGI